MSKIKIARKFYGIAGSLMILAIPYFIKLNSVHTNIETAQSLCPFKLLTGFPCPGCGITKSIIFLYEGDVIKSFYYHLFGPFTVVFSAIAIGVLIIELLTKREYFNSILFNRKIAYFLGGTLAFYHAVRLVLFIYTYSFDEILRQSIWR